MAKLTTVTLFIVITSINNWFIHQLDVNNVFLHGDLQQDVYMIIPSGITSSKPNQVCKLQKSLYGLKQANIKWYENLTSTLIRNGYAQANDDHSLFTKKYPKSFTNLLIYMYDIILSVNSLDEFDKIKSISYQSFKTKNLGQLKYFLDFEVAHSKTGISLCQRKYFLNLSCIFVCAWLKTNLHIYKFFNQIIP